MSKRAFVSRMLKACEIAKQKGAVLNTEAVIAQAALESGWGRSKLAAVQNNLFGIKAASDWTGPVVTYKTFEWRNGRYVEEVARWAVFPSWNECLVYYSSLIRARRWFQDALPHADLPAGDGDARAWIFRLVDQDYPGELKWATSPDYVNKVIDRVGYEIAVIRKEIDEETA